MSWTEFTVKIVSIAASIILALYVLGRDERKERRSRLAAFESVEYQKCLDLLLEAAQLFGIVRSRIIKRLHAADTGDTTVHRETVSQLIEDHSRMNALMAQCGVLISGPVTVGMAKVAAVVQKYAECTSLESEEARVADAEYVEAIIGLTDNIRTELKLDSLSQSVEKTIFERLIEAERSSLMRH